MTNFGFIPTGESIIVDPYYGNDEKVGSLYLPNANTNPMSQVGKVMEVGPQQTEIRRGDVVAYRPFCGHTFRLRDYEYLVYKNYDVVGFVTGDGQLWPRKDSVLVLPHWSPREEHLPSGIIRLNRLDDRPDPPVWGTVLKVGEDVKFVKPREKIIIPSVGGFEMGFIDTVYYLVRETDIPAKLED